MELLNPINTDAKLNVYRIEITEFEMVALTDLAKYAVRGGAEPPPDACTVVNKFYGIAGDMMSDRMWAIQHPVK